MCTKLEVSAFAIPEIFQEK